MTLERGTLGSGTLGTGTLGLLLEEIEPILIKESGVKETAHALNIGETYLIPNDGRVYLRVQPQSADAIVTIYVPQYVDEELHISPREVEIKKGETKEIGPFPQSIYNNEEDQIEVEVNVAGVACAALQLNRIRI